MFKVIIAGGRDFTDYQMLARKCDAILKNIKAGVEIVCGGARGADDLGRKYAEQRGYQTKLFPADWNRDGRAAGMLRNTRMGDYADALIAFWDGKSKGTKNMIDYANSKELKIRIINY